MLARHSSTSLSNPPSVRCQVSISWLHVNLYVFMRTQNERANERAFTGEAKGYTNINMHVPHSFDHPTRSGRTSCERTSPCARLAAILSANRVSRRLEAEHACSCVENVSSKDGRRSDVQMHAQYYKQP